MNQYIVWVNYGYDGWSPTYYDTLEKAIRHKGYEEKIITKEVNYKIEEDNK